MKSLHVRSVLACGPLLAGMLRRMCLGREVNMLEKKAEREWFELVWAEAAPQLRARRSGR
jgi:hypothetical protein